ncbi:hypothetical protein ABK730_07825 [Klebsiella indica]|uniref:hypothetical protein n=1 Tax=Klebsiella TaxID=570 RepID=UPI00163C5CEF|nr:hypothetical protein [Klebsiella sp. 2680]
MALSKYALTRTLEVVSDYQANVLLFRVSLVKSQTGFALPTGASSARRSRLE